MKPILFEQRDRAFLSYRLYVASHLPHAMPSIFNTVLIIFLLLVVFLYSNNSKNISQLRKRAFMPVNYFTHSKQASEVTVLTEAVLYILFNLFKSASFVSNGGLKYPFGTYILSIFFKKAGKIKCLFLLNTTITALKWKRQNGIEVYAVI